MPHLLRTAGIATAAITMSMVTTAPASADPYGTRITARFAPPTAFIPSAALTYDFNLVPAAASIEVVERADGTGTTVTLSVHGLARGRTYGVHVDAKSCGADPSVADSRYQNVADPHQPSVDPSYANSRNEVWLDFTTDAEGDGTATSQNPWRFRHGEARSVVIREHATTSEPGRAGTAGARLACVTVPFG